MASALLARVARLERGTPPGACPECVNYSLCRRVDRDATPEQVEAARRCGACGRRLEFVHLVAMTPEEWDSL